MKRVGGGGLLRNKKKKKEEKKKEKEITQNIRLREENFSIAPLERKGIMGQDEKKKQDWSGGKSRGKEEKWARQPTTPLI